MDGYVIRQARTADSEAIIDICVRTADRGGDGRHCYSDPQYPAFLWALPYLVLEPEQAFVLTHGADVVGYAVGTAETRAFAAKLEKKWWPGLRQRLASADAVTPGDRYVLEYVSQPETVPDAISEKYPAHLHINLLPHAQGKGRGTRLLETLLASLANSGAAGVHLGVNHQNEPVTHFYRKLGFNEIARLPSIIMAKRF